MSTELTNLAINKLTEDAREDYIKSDANITWFLNEEHHYRESKLSMLKEAFERGAKAGLEVAETIRQKLEKEAAVKCPPLTVQIATKEILGSHFAGGQAVIYIDHERKGINQNQYYALLELGWKADGANSFIYIGK